MHTILKSFITILGVSLLLALATMGVFYLWHLDLISWPLFWKIWITSFIIVVLCYLLWLLFSTLFTHDRYDKNKGNRAHPME